MKKFRYITIALFLFVYSKNTIAQFTFVSGGEWNTSVSSVDHLSIGTTGTFPAALYIDGANLSNTTNGNVLETNGPSATATTWKMNQTGQGETFRIVNASSSNNVALGTVASGRFDIFTNGTANPRVSVTSGGNVGIGTTTPNNLVQAHGGLLQITSSNTGSTSVDGLLIGQDASTATAEIIQQENSPLKIYTASTQRIYVEASGTGSASGFVGIGNNFTSPASRLHIRQGSGDNAWFQITGDNTGSSSTDGLRIGVINSSTATAQHVEIKQQENADMNFQTYATQRMTIKADGKVGINVTSPQAQLEVVAPVQRITNTYLSNDQTGQNLGASIDVKGLQVNTISGNANNGAYGVFNEVTGPANVYGEYIASSTSDAAAYTVGVKTVITGVGYNIGIGGTVSGSTNRNTGIGYTVTGNGTCPVNTGAELTINYGAANSANTGVSVLMPATASPPTGATNIGGGFTVNDGLINKGVSAGAGSPHYATATNYGGEFSASGGALNYGVYSTATGGSSLNEGLHAEATGTSTASAYGVYGKATGVSGSSAYGVKGEASGGSVANYGIYGVMTTTNSGEPQPQSIPVQ